MVDESEQIVLRARVREAARDFRRIALEIESQPQAISRYLDLEGVRWMTYMSIPEGFSPRSPADMPGKKRFVIRCRERVTIMENLAYGDVGVTLASPGPALSGPLVDDLGSEAQRELYFSTLLARPTWTFFALSEPARGSDASNLTTRLTRDPDQSDLFRLDGEKYFSGNGARARLGVVFARRSPGPLGIEIALLRLPLPGFTALPLPTIGMRAGELSHLTFESCRVETSDLLGQHLSPSKRGLWGAIQTFNRMRPGVAAMALGLAQAVYDYIVESRRDLTQKESSSLEHFAARLHAVRATIYRAALEVDAGPADGTLASMAKVSAVELVEEITESAPAFFGPGALLEHPFLNKWFRDARGLEYMEGTSVILRLKVGQAYVTGKLSGA